MEIERIDRRTIYVPYYIKGRLKIKIVMRRGVEGKTTYIFYNGVTKWPFTLPFLTRWVTEAVCFSDETFNERMREYMACGGPMKIIVEDKRYENQN